MKCSPRPRSNCFSPVKQPLSSSPSFLPLPFPSTLHLIYLSCLFLFFLVHLPLFLQSRNSDRAVGPRWSALSFDLKVVLAVSRRVGWADVVLRPERCSTIKRMLYGQRLLTAGRVLVLNGCFFHHSLWRSSSWPKTAQLAFPRRFRTSSSSSSLRNPPTSLEIASLQLFLLSHYLLPPLFSLLTLSGSLNYLAFTALLLLHSSAWVPLLVLLKLYALARGEKMRTWRKLVRNCLFEVVVVVVSFL